MLREASDTAGFVIVGMFIVIWAATILIWRYARIKEKWSARLVGSETTAPEAD